jgi:hypothetical protein
MSNHSNLFTSSRIKQSEGMKMDVSDDPWVGLSLLYLIIPMHFVFGLTKIEKVNSPLEKIRGELTCSIYFSPLLKAMEVRLTW